MTEMIALGAMNFGTKVPADVSRDILDAFVEAGGTWIDTANCYAFWASEDDRGGQSESVLGEWLASNRARAAVKLSTKVGASPTRPGGFPRDVEGLSRRSVDAAVAGSLHRMGVDAIDLYWAHMEDRTQSVEQVVESFGSLVERGTVAEIGLSNHPAWYAAAANTYARHAAIPGFTALQLRESYLHPRPDIPVEGEDHPNGMMTPESRDYARHSGVALWAYTPLLTGLYEDPGRALPAAYEHPGSVARLSKVRRWARELNVTPSQVVLAWLITGTPPVIPIVGCRTPAQAREAVAAASITLPPEAVQDLDDHG